MHLPKHKFKCKAPVLWKPLLEWAVLAAAVSTGPVTGWSKKAFWRVTAFAVQPDQFELPKLFRRKNGQPYEFPLNIISMLIKYFLSFQQGLGPSSFTTFGGDDR